MKQINTIHKKEFLYKIISLSLGLVLISQVSACGFIATANTAKIQNPENLNNVQNKCEISAYELHKILTAHFGHVRIKLSDANYTLPDNGEISQLSAPSRYELYGVSEAMRSNWDCDDYAIAAMAPMRNYAFGAMYITTTSGYRHVINVFVNPKKEVVYWEPQTCRLFTDRFYRPELIIF